MKTDIQIAQEAKMQPIWEVAKKLDIEPDDLELYECYKGLIEKVRAWVADTFDDVSKVKALVS